VGSHDILLSMMQLFRSFANQQYGHALVFQDFQVCLVGSAC